VHNLLFFVSCILTDKVEIVSEMLRCKMRSIDARNEDGQTAGHIAAINNLSEILQLLIRARTNVNAKDSSSCTPLHVRLTFSKLTCPQCVLT